MDKIGELATAVLERAKGGGSQESRSLGPARPATTTKAPELFERPTDLELPKLLSGYIPDNVPREIMRALTGPELAAVKARARALRMGLASYLDSERDAVESDIAAMLGGFRAMRQQGEDAEGLVAATAMVLREFPVWAIREGCFKIARNQAGLDRRYAPNDTEIYAVVSEIVRDYRKRLATAEALLAAPLAPPRSLPPPATEVEAVIGRPIGVRPEAKIAPEVPASDGRHAARVAADLAQRRARAPLSLPSSSKSNG